MTKSIACGIRWMLLAATAAAPVAAQQSVSLPSRDNTLGDRPADVFSVGTVEGENWEMFSGIRSIVFDASDNMYVLDAQNTRVVVFDATGRFVRQFGKKGGGPGELQAPFAMALSSDGNVVVSDLANRAFVVFGPDGEYVRNVTFGDDLGFPTAIDADRRGGVVVRAFQRPRPDQPPGEAAYSPIFRQSLTGGEPHMLYRVPVTPPRMIDGSSTAGTRRVGAIRMDPIFGPAASFGALPSGLAVHHETEYAIRILDDAGRHVRTLTRNFKPKKVTKQHQEEWQEQRSRDVAQGAGPTVVMSRTSPAGTSTTVGRAPSGAVTFTVDDMPFAELMAVVTSIRTDPLGRIWVQRRGDGIAAAGPIDLVMPDGRYIGTLPAQPMPSAVSTSGLAAWVVTDDDLGVERVVVRRLPASWR
jgi:hypothetical protein